MKKKILIVFGTRPEAIKMIPLIKQFEINENFKIKIALTGQHNDMIYPILKKYNIVEDYNFNIMKTNQTLDNITVEVLKNLQKIFNEEYNPDICIVHGDTTTSFSAALSAFYNRIPVAHIEAGLRTYNNYSPFPEEFNRQGIGSLANFHFAPTKENYFNLLKEGKCKKNIFITGNTGIDSLRMSLDNKDINIDEYKKKIKNKKLILVTIHRRENFGEKIKNIFKSIKKLALEFKDYIFLYPVHMNPNVKIPAYDILSYVDNVILTNPIDVFKFHHLLNSCYLVMTDSGGIQEESTFLGKPVLLLRDDTEREEALNTGTMQLLGTNTNNIYKKTKKILSDPNEYKKYAHKSMVFGDGHASEKIINFLKQHV